jgi:ribosomal protein L11 methyltransferase
MKPENPTGGAILTLIAAQSDAIEIENWATDFLGKTIVELKKPGSLDVALEIYFDTALEAEIALRAMGDFPIKASSIREYAAEEWSESWKKHFKPMDFGNRLRVVPPWSAGSGAGNRVELILNPGLSFGTGSHFTTRFCLEQLDRFIPQSGAKTMLDIGTGSGILAIAAAKLGVESVIGTDFDPVCVDCAMKNAAINGVKEKTSFFQHDMTEGWNGDSAEIVCANIYSSLLIDNASVLLRAATRYLILTGIREMELDGVADTFVRLGGREVVRDCDGEWGGLVINVSG